MDFITTPDHCFENLDGYNFTPHYYDVEAADKTKLRLHYLDEGPSDGEVILCMHGEPSWCYLYRKMIPILTAAGYRVLAPDLIGFGRSDKPTQIESYTYRNHVDWMNQWLSGLNVQGATLVCQDWGGLIGLRMVGDHPDRFARLVIANTGLPGSHSISKELSEMMGKMYESVPIPNAEMVQEQFREGSQIAFLYWVKYAQASPEFSVRDVFKLLSNIKGERVLDGYEAPFPDDSYIAGARAFPTLVPLMPHHQSDRDDNDRAWEILKKFDRPVLTAFSDGDPVTKGGEVPFQKFIPGAKDVAHVTIKNGGHFLQEDQPESLSQAVIDFMKKH